jgi:ubiquinone/menaquinone biosynthesis C-methylase UbiE
MADFPAMNKYFGATAARYDDVRAPKAGTLRDQVTVENYLEKLAPGTSVVDIPAGTGRFIEFCIRRGLIYTGIDISQDMLEVAKAKIQPGVTNVKLMVADARALPFANDAFDYAIVVKFIKWLPTENILIDVLREIGRVTRREMLVQINVSPKSRPSLATRVAKILGQFPLPGTLRFDDLNAKAGTRAYSEQELADAVSAAGLHIRSIVPCHRPLKKKPSSNTCRPGLNFYILTKET